MSCVCVADLAAGALAFGAIVLDFLLVLDPVTPTNAALFVVNLPHLFSFFFSPCDPASASLDPAVSHTCTHPGGTFISP